MKDAEEHLLAEDGYKLTNEGEWLTPHIQSFQINSTGEHEIDRVRFEVRVTCLQFS